ASDSCVCRASHGQDTRNVSMTSTRRSRAAPGLSPVTGGSPPRQRSGVTRGPHCCAASLAPRDTPQHGGGSCGFGEGVGSPPPGGGGGGGGGKNGSRAGFHLPHLRVGFIPPRLAPVRRS